MAVKTKIRPATTYEWVAGRRFGVSADVTGREIERLKKRDGLCKPQAFVDAARPENSPIHDLLPWDDAVAAEAHRRQVSRQIIAAIRPVDSPTPHARAFVYVNVVNASGDIDEGYASLTEVRMRPDYRMSAVAEARTYLAHGKHRFGWLKELERIWAVIEEDAEEAA